MPDHSAEIGAPAAMPDRDAETARPCSTCGDALSGPGAPHSRCVACQHWEDECTCARAAGLFVDLDGENEPTLWRRTEQPEAPAAVLRRCDLPSAHRDLWDRLTDVLGTASQSTPATRWRCDMHGRWTTGDCPRCDDDLIALTGEEPDHV